MKIFSLCPSLCRTSEEVHPKKDTVIEAKIKRKVELGISGYLDKFL